MKKRLTERYVQTLQPPAEGRLEVGDDVAQMAHRLRKARALLRAAELVEEGLE